MATTGAYQQRFSPTAPINGSFPLDKAALCKAHAQAYMECMRGNGRYSSECRTTARRYFECRMENGLMDREDMGRLGFRDEEAGKAEKAKGGEQAPTTTSKEA